MSCRGSQSSPGRSCRAVCLTSSLSTNRLRRCSAWTMATRIHSIRGGRRGNGLRETCSYSVIYQHLSLHPSIFLLAKMLKKCLNPAKCGGDQQWHKTGSERNVDSEITKAADLAHHRLFQSCHLLPQTSLNHNLYNNTCHLSHTHSRWNSNQCDITERILYGFLIL